MRSSQAQQEGQELPDKADDIMLRRLIWLVGLLWDGGKAAGGVSFSWFMALDKQPWLEHPVLHAHDR